VVANCLRSIVGLLLLAAWLTPAYSQDSGQFYKKPETPAEFWRAMKHEIAVGQFKIAAAYLKGFIDKSPSDEELLEIQEKEGNSAFLRLLTIPELRAGAKPLIERVNDLVQKRLSDRTRLDKLIKNLNASPEERDFSIAQLQRSGALAVPALVAALLRTADDIPEHAAILSALPLLGKDAVPPLLAALDVNDANLKAELIDVTRRRAETAATPHLWFLAASPKETSVVRTKALDALAAFRGVPPQKLPPAKAALTQEAQRYYQHQVQFPDPAAVTLWRWNGKELVSETLSASQIEEYYGLRFARQALDLDPSYLPAQVAFLSLVLDKGIDRPGAKELLRSARPELVMAVLDRALNERRVAVILASATALGDQAEIRAVRPTAGGNTPVLVRALDFPDRRVQLAAADAILRIPSPAASPANSRVIDILRRALAGDSETKAKGKVLVGFANPDLGSKAAAAARKAGYEAVTVHSGREALARLNEAADIDVILIDTALPNPGLQSLLAQLRADIYAGGLPLLIATPGGREESVRPMVEAYDLMAQRLQASRESAERFAKGGQVGLAAQSREQGARLSADLERLTRRYNDESANIEASLRRGVEHYRDVVVIPLEQAVDGKMLAFVLQTQTPAGSLRPLSPAERSDAAAKAIEWFARIARGEPRGYDLQPAEGAILSTLHSKELGGLAVDASAGLRGRNVQRELAALVTDPGSPEELRSAAAIELCRHVQRDGLGLTEAQATGVQKLYDGLPDSKFKANVALVVSSLHPDARQTGLRLEGYTPKTAAAPKPAAPAPKPKEEKQDSDK